MKVLEKTYESLDIAKKDFDEFINSHESIKCKKGTYLLKEYQTSHCYYILVEGFVRSYVIDYLGNEQTTELYLPNDLVIDEASLFHLMPTQENFVCMSDCILWKIELENFNRFYTQFPEVSEWGRRWMSYQLLLNKQFKIDLIKESAQFRYLKLINNRPNILQMVPLKYIASYLGITDTSLSRLRKELIQK